MVIAGMNLVGCAMELFVINRWGRRSLTLWGMAMLMALLLLIGILGCVPSNASVLRALAAFLILINLIYHATIGPVTYTVAAEIHASRLRQRTVTFGRG
jgi:SP family general alpha glucoside:H+ symporter-like MFS transporter